MNIKIKNYEIEEEIQKLHKFVDRGYFTDEVRPKAQSSASEPAGDQPQVLPPQEQPKEGNPTMENVDKDVAAMLASLKKYDKLVESVSPVLGMVTLGAKPQLNELSQETLKSYKSAARDDGRMGMIKNDQAKMDKRSAGMKQADARIKEEEDESLNEKKKPDFLDFDKDEDKKEPFTKALKDKEKKEDNKPDFLKKDDKEKVKEGADQEVLEWMQRFSKLGNMKGYGR